MPKYKRRPPAAAYITDLRQADGNGSATIAEAEPIPEPVIVEEVVVEPEAVAITTTEDVAPTPIKRKPGRPRKVKTDD